MSDQIPRLSVSEMPPELATFLGPRVKRLGYLGEFFQCTAHQPEALLSFLHFTEHLKHALPNNLVELVSLSVAVLMKNDYERIQHERLSRKLGFSEDWIHDVLSLHGQKHLSQQESVVQRFAVAVVQRHGHHTTPEFEATIEAVGHSQAMALLMLIGRYMSHAIIANTLNLSPPPLAINGEKKT